MLKDKKPLRESDLFEALNQQESESIKGGETITISTRTPRGWWWVRKDSEDNYLYTAPLGYYIDNTEGATNLTTYGYGGGLDHGYSCTTEYSGFVELLPGVEFPRVVNLEANAWVVSGGGARAGVNCTFTFDIFQA